MKILDMPCTKGFMQLAQDGDLKLRFTHSTFIIVR